MIIKNLVTIIQTAHMLDGANMQFVAANGSLFQIVSDPRCAGMFEVNPAARTRKPVNCIQMQAAFNTAEEVTIFRFRIEDGNVINRNAFVSGMMAAARS